MDLLTRFINYFTSQKTKPSRLTVKNYLSDLRHFIRWYELSFGKKFDPASITHQIIEIYKNQKILSPRSLERHLSSLRKFFYFLKAEEIILQNPLEVLVSNNTFMQNLDPYKLKNFKNALYSSKASDVTIKNYIIDIQHFLRWINEVTTNKNAWDIDEDNIFNKINSFLVEEYKKRLIEGNFSPLTVNRKLSSLRKYINWAIQEGLIRIKEFEIKNERKGKISPLHLNPLASTNNDLNSSNLSSVQKKYSRFPPLRLLQKITKGLITLTDIIFIYNLARALKTSRGFFWNFRKRSIFGNSEPKTRSPNSTFSGIPIFNIKKRVYAPLNISTKNIPIYKKIWHHLNHTRPKWYKNYHNYSIAHYLHFAILIVCMSALGVAFYQTLFEKAQSQNPLLAAIPLSATRTLSFQGRLADNQNNPIIVARQVRFGIYDSPTASGSSLIWEEANTVIPDQNGTFSTVLGNKNNISQNIFTKHPQLWLGITVDNTPELVPRQQLATAVFAANSQTLQGLEPITNSNNTSNVILALNSSGNLTIGGSASPTFQVTGGQFTLSGNILLLTTNAGSDSNVEINPDGMGRIDLQKPIFNSTNNNNIATAAGAVEIDDMVAILATSSGQSALTINQNSIGPIISASTSGVAKFTVDSLNGVTIADNLRVEGAGPSHFMGNLGIGNASPLTALDVTGSASLSANLSLNGSSITHSLNILDNGTLNIQRSPSGDTELISTVFIGNNGNIGMGTISPELKLDIQDNKLSTAVARIYNQDTGNNADGLVIKLGNTSSNVNNTNQFLRFETLGLGETGSIQGNGAKGITYATSGVADFAEYFKKDENQHIEYGSIVCIDNANLATPCDSNQTRVIGVASEKPAFLGGENLGNKSIAVGLVGQVHTKVSTLNGPIKPGDPLTYSPIKGTAIKAIKAGQIIGKALESYNDTAKEGKILTSVNISWYDPDAYLTSAGNLLIAKTNFSYLPNTKYAVQNTLGQIIDRVGAFTEILVSNLKVGFIKTEEITTESINIVTDSATIAGQNLREYILSVVQNSELIIKNSEIKSPLAKIDRVQTNFISPLAQEPKIAIKIEDSQISIINPALSTSSAVVTIDNDGNARFEGDLQARQASFSGQLSSSSLTTEDATVSGTLRAKRILAEQIEGLEDRFGSMIERNRKTSTSSAELPKPEEELKVSDLAIANPSSIFISSSSGQLTYIENLNADRAIFNLGLMAFGASSFTDISVVNEISIGTDLILADTSVNVLGKDFEIQSMRQGGVSIMAGLIYIDATGNLKVSGNAEFNNDILVKGNLTTNIVSPIPGSDLVVKLKANESSDTIYNSSFIIQNASESAVLAINQAGDIISSGSARFDGDVDAKLATLSKLNLKIISPAIALSDTELISTGSAGTAVIKARKSELTINNSSVTEKSLIYVTPVGTPSAQAPFLLKQIPEKSFTVGLQTPAQKDTLFNWLIIN